MTDSDIDGNIVPQYSGFDQVYSHSVDMGRHVQRYSRMVIEAMKRTGSLTPNASPPTLWNFARAPGRVNVIGEHIDYQGYGVLPMALIDQDVVILHHSTSAQGGGGSGGDTETSLRIMLCNMEQDKYSTRVIDIELTADRTLLDESVVIDHEQHHWTHYCLCGLKGALQLLGGSAAVPEHVSELHLMYDGTVPQASGLSSSSALTCCSAMAFVNLLDPHAMARLSKRDFALACIESERHIGMESGGMDQSICFLGRQGSASFISFEPSLTASLSDLRLGDQYRFVIGHCMKESAKGVTAEMNYNRRVVETRMGCAILAKRLLKPEEWRAHFLDIVATGPNGERPKTLHWLQRHLQYSYDEMVAAADRYLCCGITDNDHDVWDMAQVSSALGLSFADIQRNFLGPIPISNHSHGLKLQSRCTHVFREAWRVELFRSPPPGLERDQLARFYGALMNQSHESCSKLYECSCDELETLRNLALRQEEAVFGVRLTGAGWGGCCVMLVRADLVTELLDTLWSEYYEDKVAQGQARDSVLFSTDAGNGAALLTIPPELLLAKN